MRSGEVLGVEHGVRRATWARQENNKASAGAPRADTNNGMENSAAGIQGANAHSQTHAMSYASTVKVQHKKPHATSNAWHTQ